MEWTEIRRQLFHLVNGTIILIAFKNYGKSIGVILLILSLIGAVLSWYHSHVKPFNWAKPFLSALERRENMKFPGKGAILYGISVGITVLFFDSIPAQCGIIALAYGDAFSTIIGRIFGKRKIPWNKKLSLEGSIAFVLATIILGSLFIPVYLAFLAAIVGAFIETIPKVDDNISIPLFTAFILSIIT